jgi:hypothetical protein
VVERESVELGDDETEDGEHAYTPVLHGTRHRRPAVERQ